MPETSPRRRRRARVMPRPIARVPAASVVAVAETIGAPRLDDAAARALASDVEYRLRMILQDAMKIMRHGKRETLLPEVRARS